jgi:Mrp family chromosome partitioning ATPase
MTRKRSAPPLVTAAHPGARLPLVTQPLARVDGPAPPFGRAAGAARVPAVDGPAPPFGRAAGAARVPAVDGPAPPFGRAAGAAQVPAVDDPGATVAFVSQTVLAPSMLGKAMTAAPVEIALTQHALPEDQDPDRRLALVRDPDSLRSAQFRVLRHHLLALGRPQVIVVTSPQRAEGKTTVAANLALALAECGRAKVLLVEAHLRGPQLARMFRLAPRWCFAAQLAAHRTQPEMPWSVVEIPQLWMHVAAIDPQIEQQQLLDAPAFAIAMDRLRLAGYDHIVVDGPPVLGSADVNLIADAADAVVLALRTRRSTARDVRTATEQLGGTKIAGTVLVQ